MVKFGVTIKLSVKEKASMNSMKNLDDLEYVKEKVIPQYEELTTWFAQKHVKELLSGNIMESKSLEHDFEVKTEKDIANSQIEEIEKEAGIKTKERIKEELDGVDDVIVNIKKIEEG